MPIQLVRCQKRRKGNNRKSLHNEDLVLFGGMVTPELKAVAQYSATILNISMMELMINGILSEGTRAGVIENGVVKPEHEIAIQTLANVFREKLRVSREESAKRKAGNK